MANSKGKACVSDSNSNPTNGHSNSAACLQGYTGRSSNYSCIR
jgi:hypothetical protein